MRPWQWFEHSQLPAHVKTALQTSDLWQFLEGNNSEENATTVARYLWDVFVAAARAEIPEIQVEVAQLLVKPGLQESRWLAFNRSSLATAMEQLFQQLPPRPEGRGHARVAFAVAVFGGALACRTLLTQMSDKAEKQRLLAQVYYWLKSDPDECEVLFAFQ